MMKILISHPHLKLSDFDIVLQLNDDVIRIDRNLEKETKDDVSLDAFIERVVNKLVDEKRFRTAETYQCMRRSLARYTGGHLPVLRNVDGLFVKSYEHYLKNNHVSMNTISFYMRIFRAVYNRAVKHKLVIDSHPFSEVYTGVCKTQKRAVEIGVLKRLKAFNYKSPAEQFACDMFLFSFYTRGMSFVDMAYLKKKDLENGYLTYVRRKTGFKMVVKWERSMEEIVRRYPTGSSQYLLPIICRNDRDEWKQYHSKQNCINTQLKRISQELGLQQVLTMYVARHSWASIANQMNIPMETIRQAMGHSSEKTTRIYIKTIENSYVDKVNRKLINIINL